MLPLAFPGPPSCWLWSHEHPRWDQKGTSSQGGPLVCWFQAIAALARGIIQSHHLLAEKGVLSGGGGGGGGGGGALVPLPSCLVFGNVVGGPGGALGMGAAFFEGSAGAAGGFCAGFLANVGITRALLGGVGGGAAAALVLGKEADAPAGADVCCSNIWSDAG